ncbi:MAG: hypothetical protein Kow0031_05160 [Anaerolineae bacterium]
MTYSTYYPKFVTALNDEIAALRKSGGQKSYLSDGQYLGARDGAYIYSFTADTELKFPDETPVDLEYQRKRHEGKIVSIDGFDVVLALKDFLADRIATAILYTEPWFLLEALKERLAEIRDIPHAQQAKLTQSQAIKLLDPSLKVSRPQPVEAEKLLAITAGQLGKNLLYNEHQLKAVAHVLGNPASFIWGPPGTGKTQTLGLTVAALVNAGKSVLILAHSNVAVDVAMVGVAKNLHRSPEYAAGQILRFGISHKPEMKQYPKLDVREVLREQNPKLVTDIESLEELKRKLTKESRQPSLAYDKKQQIKDTLS